MAAGDFSMILLPDKQNLTSNSAAHAQGWDNVISWIRANKNASGKEIKAVISFGDLTNDGGNATWIGYAHSGYAGGLGIQSILSDGIAVVISPGNHDYDAGELSGGTRTIDDYNTLFGAELAAQSGFGGTFEAGSYANTYVELTVGSSKLLLLGLECFPRREVIAWAKTVIASHSDRHVIISTHSHLVATVADDGVGLLSSRSGALGNTYGVDAYTMGTNAVCGVELWDELLRLYPNILMVMSGHYLVANSSYLKVVGNYGNFVHQLYANWQNEEYTDRQGRILRLNFSPSTNSIGVECLLVTAADTASALDPAEPIDNSWEWNAIPSTAALSKMYRTEITVHRAKVGTGSHSKFPILLTEANLPSGIFTDAFKTGGDIRFFSDAGCTNGLPCEIGFFDAANSKAQIWVAATVSADADTTIYMRYGGPATSQPAASSTFGKNNVWDSHYLAVWHLNDLQDSKGVLHLQPKNTSPIVGTDGKIGRCFNFNRTGYLDAAAFTKVAAFQATISAWYKMPDVADAEQRILFNAGPDYNVRFGWRNEGGLTNQMQALCRVFTLDPYAYMAQSTTNVLQATFTPSADWTHAAVRYRYNVSGNKALTVLFNGSVNCTDGTANGNDVAWYGHGNISGLHIGDAEGGADNTGLSFDGKVQEVRVSDIYRSDAWELTCYNSMNDPATFATSGAPVEFISGTSYNFNLLIP